MKSRVLCLIDTFEVGGTEQSLLELVTRFDRLEPVVCSLYQGQTLRPRFEAAGVATRTLGLTGKYDLRRAIQGVDELIRELRPALLHSLLFRASLVGRVLARMTGLPLVDTFVNDSYTPERRASTGRRQRAKLRLVQLCDAVTVRWATSFLANSATIAASNSAALRVADHRIHVIPRGRNPARYEGLSSQGRADLRAALGVPGPLVLNVARLIGRKGHAELIEAVALLRCDRGGLRLLIAGDGPARGDLDAQITRFGLEAHVRLLGRRSDVPSLLQAADVFVFPSHYEGHPGALVEAMLAGPPIVAADTPVHRETLGHSTALLVPVRSPRALAAAIERLLSDRALALELGARARARARAEFDIAHVARRYEDELVALATSVRS